MRTLLLLFALTLSCLAQPLSPNDPAFLQSTSPLRRGLIGYWRLEESSGTRYDCSSTGAHLTDNNSVGQGTGVQTFCSSFVSASNQSLSASSSNTFQFSTNTPFTVSMWVKLTNNLGPQVLMSKYDDAINRGWIIIGASASHLAAEEASSTTEAFYAIGTAVLTNAAWHHIAVIYSGIPVANGFRLFVDGNVDPYTVTNNAVSMSTIDNTGVFKIGNGSGAPSNGLIDEVGLWTNVLSDSFITNNLYRAGVGTHFPWAHP